MSSTAWLSNMLRVNSASEFAFAPISESTPVDCDRAPISTLSLFAGNAAGFGNVDGNGARARFKRPNGVAVDAAGNLYVADSGNHTIRKVSPAGTVTTLAGAAEVTGSDDGTGTSARFASPMGVAEDSSGTLYVTDSANFTIRKITAHGSTSTLAGATSSTGNTDGIGASASFHSLSGIAVDSSGKLYVADNHPIRTISPAERVTTLAGTAPIPGHKDGSQAALFVGPEV